MRPVRRVAELGSFGKTIMYLRLKPDDPGAQEPQRAEFAEQFGEEIIYERCEIGSPRLRSVTTAVVCVRPDKTKEETLDSCWFYVRESPDGWLRAFVDIPMMNNSRYSLRGARQFGSTKDTYSR